MDLSIKKNLKTYRKIQEMSSPNTVNKKHYKDTFISGVPVRIFNPQNDKLLIYIHGGGWVSGSLDTHANICYKLAKELNRKVIAIGYSLSPEVKFPTALNECILVTSALSEHNDIILMGDSAGATLAMMVGIELKKKLKFQRIILIYPSCQTDYSQNTKYRSVITNSNKSFLKQKHLEEYLSMYFENKKDYKHKRANLIKNNHLFRVAPTILITGTLDPLHDEGLRYAQKLKRFFVSLKHYDLDGATHGFLTRALEKKYTNQVIEILKKEVSNE